MASAAHETPDDDRAAFEESLAATYPVLFNRLARRFGDEQLAEEVSQDCLSQAFEKWLAHPNYFATHDLTAWTSRRAAWRALDRLRERGRHRPLPEERPLDDEQERGLAAALAVPQSDEAERVMRDRHLTWEALQRLAPEDRDLLLAWFYDHRSDQEIGSDLFGEDDGTAQARGLRVWRRRQRAQARLKDLLIDVGIDPADWVGSHQAV